MLRAMHEFKLLDGKFLTTRDVIESLATDNCQVFDSDNSYNLEFEVFAKESITISGKEGGDSL